MDLSQGFGVQLSKLEIKLPAFRQAIMAVLTDAQYTEAAIALSVKVRARKDTPLQEAAGTLESQHLVLHLAHAIQAMPSP